MNDKGLTGERGETKTVPEQEEKRDTNRKEIHMRSTLAALLVLGLLAGTAGADALPITDVYGHNEKTNYDGKINDMIIGSGMNTYGVDGNPGWPAGEGDPSTWTATSNGYQYEWQSLDLLAAQTPAEDLRHDGTPMSDGEGPTNDKIGWTVFDLGSAQSLTDLYIWHIRERSDRVALTYNVYVAASPTAAVPHGPTGNNSRDYDFASGGWTLIGASTGSWKGDTTVALNTSARYIGLEILTGGDGNRVGFAEVGVVPEPATMSLLALGGLGVLARRRRS